jgi:hypothetical protein
MVVANTADKALKEKIKLLQPKNRVFVATNTTAGIPADKLDWDYLHKNDPKMLQTIKVD